MKNFLNKLIYFWKSMWKDIVTDTAEEYDSKTSKFFVKCGCISFYSIFYIFYIFYINMNSDGITRGRQYIIFK